MNAATLSVSERERLAFVWHLEPDPVRSFERFLATLR
jgi:hypothetical protein